MEKPTGFGFPRPPQADPEPDAPITEAAVPEPRPLGDDAELDLSADESATRVAETLASLDAELVGLAPVKRRVREIASLLQVDRARERFGLTSSTPTLHMSFTGGPGTGKTTVAMRMATILHALGYIRTPRVHVVTRDDLVGQFIGHTAPKTKEALARAAGGVLFIDEAYYLFRPDNERDYGQEVIEILLTEMEDEHSDLVVIFAGYPERMATFFSANPGLSSRVPHHIEFHDYDHAELVQIADLMVAEENFRFSEHAREVFAEYLTRRMERPNFSNARSVRNAIERSRLRQARRLVALNRPLRKEDLVTITAEDIYGSSVFAGASSEH
ncbi:AAA family ATPase [Saccharopolyspora rhizosphaerae]|uniref:AAA family ATPase n=1 Tax=Saccharopolyspora rhizosphaerae TaxID=2492662 RepID=A0A426JV18_9PSEU|nr:AAA family ATPase [Saccharopolyspora rhizosphaerae]RRO16952.1 AAA family ATPase [Saccharopolyspora rhizosphaerae]